MPCHEDAAGTIRDDPTEMLDVTEAWPLHFAGQPPVGNGVIGSLSRNPMALPVGFMLHEYRTNLSSGGKLENGY